MKHSVNKNPCESCPYRRDVPSGIWHQSEYEKLLAYDRETFDQQNSPFACHSSPESLCRGWVVVHGLELLSLRLLVMRELVECDQLDEETTVACFGSAREAYDHGMVDLIPGERAKRAIDKIKTIRGL